MMLKPSQAPSSSQSCMWSTSCSGVPTNEPCERLAATRMPHSRTDRPSRSARSIRLHHAGREGAAAGADVGGRQRAILRIVVEPELHLLAQHPDADRGMQKLVQHLLLVERLLLRSSPGSAAGRAAPSGCSGSRPWRRHARLHRRPELARLRRGCFARRRSARRPSRRIPARRANRRPAPAPASPAATAAGRARRCTEKNWPW